MGLFSVIPLRANGQKFYYHWFNALRNAGVAIESFLGAAYLVETSFTVANSQGSAANVTGLSFSSLTAQSVHIYAEVRRKTGTNEVISSGRLIAVYRQLTSAWDLLDELSGDDDGVVFSITSGGQVQYISDTL